MNVSRRASRLSIALAVGSAMAAFAAFPAAATTSVDSSVARNFSITCNEVSVDGTSVLGTRCDTKRQGYIIDFNISDGRTGETWHCATGEADGNGQVIGGSCRRHS
ncbi:hypothetical protein ABZ470_23260 [Streptosporangium sp. NPDC020072]|uniref:hypothetical protein n=1 Tax=Streptosporangium sp. NPDC020072 TaxID=3154788 RepID=UPI00342561C2